MNNDIISNIFNHLRDNIVVSNTPETGNGTNNILNDVSGVYIGGGGAAALDWEDHLDQNGINTNTTRTLEGLLEERRSNIAAKTTGKEMDGQRSKLVRMMREIMSANSDFMKTDGTLVEESVALSAAFGTAIQYTEDMSATRSLMNSLLDSAGGTDTYDKYKAMCSAVFNHYQGIGIGLRAAEDKLKSSISNFDSLQSRLKVLTALGNQDGAEYAGLVAATEAYLRANYADFKVDNEFRQYITLYKQWTMLRTIVMTFRVADGTATSTGPTCGICMEDPVTHALQNCGHTYCANCIRQLGRQCAICRSAIGGKIKIFFT